MTPEFNILRDFATKDNLPAVFIDMFLPCQFDVRINTQTFSVA